MQCVATNLHPRVAGEHAVVRRLVLVVVQVYEVHPDKQMVQDELLDVPAFEMGRGGAGGAMGVEFCVAFRRRSPNPPLPQPVWKPNRNNHQDQCICQLARDAMYIMLGRVLRCLPAGSDAERQLGVGDGWHLLLARPNRVGPQLRQPGLRVGRIRNSGHCCCIQRRVSEHSLAGESN